MTGDAAPGRGLQAGPAPLSIRYAFSYGAVASPPLSIFVSGAITVVLALAGLWALWVVRGSLSRMAAVLGPVVPALAALLAWCLVAAVYAPAPLRSLMTAAALGLIALAAVALAAAGRQLGDAERTRVGRHVIAAFLVGFGLLLIELSSGGYLLTAVRDLVGYGTRIGLSDLDRAAILMLFLGMLASLALFRAGRPVLGLLALVPVPLVNLLANSRSIAIAGFASWVVAGLSFALGRRFILLLGGAATALVVTMPLLVHLALPPERWGGALAGVKYSAMHRLYIWQYAVERIKEKPVLGWGIDAYRRFAPEPVSAPGGGGLPGLHPHNAALQLWVELGLPGAVLAGLLIWLLFAGIAGLQDRRSQALAAGIAVAALIVASLSYGLWQSWWLATLGFAAALAAALVPGPAAIAQG